jgi:hypothetical protein
MSKKKRKQKPAKKRRRATAMRTKPKTSKTATPAKPTPTIAVVDRPTRQPQAATLLPEIAFYYPNPYWHDSDWVKNLILFFDGIAALIPNYMPKDSGGDDESIIEGLREHNLFHVLEPETFIDEETSTRLVSAMTDIITSGALDSLGASKDTPFHEISMSRMGFHVTRDLSQMIFDELKARGLAIETKDGVSVPLHPKVRSLVLVLLAQLLRPKGKEIGLDLSPATDSPQIVAALADLLSQPQMPSTGQVVTFDFAAVGVDAASIPIDEILGFRKDNLAMHRDYVRNVRLFTHELSVADADVREELFDRRQSELDDLSASIRKVSRKAWKKPATFLLSAAGAFWKFASGDPITGSIGAAAALLSLGSPESVDPGAYSFLFQAKARY